MSELISAKTCELHAHIGGCLTAEDLFELGSEAYDQIDWSLFVNSFESAYGTRPDPPALHRQAPAEGGGSDAFTILVYGRKTAVILPVSKPNSTLASASSRHLRQSSLIARTNCSIASSSAI